MKIFALGLILVLFSGLSIANTEDNFPLEMAGMKWSRSIGKLSNGCVHLETQEISEKLCTTEGLDNYKLKVVKTEDSKAATACKNIGGRLPTREEFDKLARSLDVTPIPSDNVMLTWEVRVALAKDFNVDPYDRNEFWTASSDGRDYMDGNIFEKAFLFKLGGNTKYVTYRTHEKNVVCVK